MTAEPRTSARSATSACFWWANLAPWLVYLLLNLALISNYTGWTTGTLLLCTSLSAALYGVSGLMRREILRRNWLELDLPALAWRLLLWVLGGALLVQGSVALLLLSALALRWIEMPGASYSPGSALMYWANTCIMLGLWLAGWIGWRALRHAREARSARMKAESERQQMELDALRARLNPHFVFNALNNLRALILEDPERARELVGRLSNTLRHALEHNRRDTVPLADELAVIEDYLAIEAVHFEDRLRVFRDIEPMARHALIPPMALQLLVENAIKHGIAITPGGGDLHIRIGSTPELLRISVENPGNLDHGGGGHGVGLTYLRHVLARVNGRFLLEQHHGKVRATLEIPQ